MGDEPWVVPDLADMPADAIPMEVLDAAHRAFEARVPGTVVLPMIFDSLLGERRATTVGVRRLRFGDADPSIELDVDGSDGRLRVSVSVVPTSAATVTVRHGGGVAEARADDRGRALGIDVATGPLSVLAEWDDDGRRAETAWVTL